MQMRNRSLARRPFWIITRYWHNRLETLTIDAETDGGSLPVFGFEEEAEAFLHFFVDAVEERGWRERETTVGELVSILMGPCARVREVTLDPLLAALAREKLPLVSVNRERFVQYLMGERGGWVKEPTLA
jgi:hypothetical protein